MDRETQKILAIDDNPDNLTVLKALLREAMPAATMLTASTGPDGIRLAVAEDPDVILLDIVMPGMDGFAVCEALKADPFLRVIPVVMLTALRTDRESRIRALELGAEGFLTKPLDEIELVAQVRAMSKVKATNERQQVEHERLKALVVERSRELEQEFAGRLQAEERSRHFSYLVESSLNEIYTFDAQSLRIVHANRGAQANIGFDLTELRRLTALDLNPDLTAEAFEDLITPLRDGSKGKIRYVGTHRRKDGTRYPIEAHLQHFSEGRPTLVAFVDDISERQMAEVERERLMAAIEQAGEAIIVTDTEGAITYVNPAFEQVSGYSREEALGRTPALTKSGEHSAAFYRQLWETIGDGRTWKGDIVNRRKDGTLYTEQTTISPVFDSSQQIVSYVAVKRDISERLRAIQERSRLEEQLRQSQKVEAIGRLAGGVAHDFNNMLSILFCYGENLLAKIPPEDELREDVREIMAAGLRSAKLTRQLLAFGRRQSLEPEPVDINQVVHNLTTMLSRLLGEDIELKLSLAEDLPCVMVDPGQIEQVIMNLVVNSRDAMPDGGCLIIETQSVRLDDDYANRHRSVAPGPYVMLAISDTGCGMDSCTLSKVFEPFFTTKKKGKGSGLGLATVYGIVKQSGGNIWAYSEPGHGSSFKVYLPETGEQPTEKTDRKPRVLLRGAGELILVVEDEPALRSIFEKFLSKCGYEVVIAANGDEALRVVRANGLQPDLVITDVIMPGMSGAALVKELRQAIPDLNVLFMSGYTDSSIAQHGVLTPEIPFIQKPFNIDDIARKIRELLRDRPN